MPSLGMLGNELSVQPNANKGSDGDSRVADRTYENDLKEATEIADNCAYFASQLRAARVRVSFGIWHTKSDLTSENGSGQSNCRMGRW